LENCKQTLFNFANFPLDKSVFKWTSVCLKNIYVTIDFHPMNAYNVDKNHFYTWSWIWVHKYLWCFCQCRIDQLDFFFIAKASVRQQNNGLNFFKQIQYCSKWFGWEFSKSILNEIYLVIYVRIFSSWEQAGYKFSLQFSS